jgi:hypothetical protein
MPLQARPRSPSQGVCDLDGGKDHALYAEGRKIATAPQGYLDGWSSGFEIVDPKTQTASMQKVAATARKSGVAILALGETESSNRET